MGRMGGTKSELWTCHDSAQGHSPEELVLWSMTL